MSESNLELLTVQSLQERIRNLEFQLRLANATIETQQIKPQQQSGKSLAKDDLSLPRYHYSQIFNNQHTPMLLIEPETGRIASANPAACAFFGWTLQEMIAMRIDQINTLTPQEFQAEMRRAMQSGSSRIFFFRHRLMDGSIRDVEVHSGPIQEDGTTYLLSIILDISNRKYSEERLSMALQASRGGAWEWDQKTGVARWSNEMYDLYGVEPGTEMNTENSFALIDERDREHVHQSFVLAIASQHDANFIFRIQHSTRAERWMETHARVVYAESGEAVHITGLTFDITERKWIEAALRESEERYRVAVKNAPAIYAQTDENLRYRWIFNSSPDFDPNIMIGKRDDELDDSEESRRLVALKRQVFETGEGLQTEVILHYPEGERSYDMTIEPLRDRFDRVVGVTTAAFDITEHKRVEQQLRLSEERFRLASEASQAVIYDLTMGREELNQSDGLEHLVGYKPGEEPGGSRNWWPANIHPEDAPRIQQALQASIEGGGDSYAYEYRIRHAKGHWVHVWDQGHILRDKNGNPIRIVGTAKDITERIKAEQQLRQSEKRFRELADAMPQLVWTADPDGTVDYYNARSQEYSGFKATENGHWEWAPSLHPDDREMTEAAWKHSIATGEVYRCEHRVHMAGGSYRWHLSRSVPARGSDGKITRWYGTATDIHETKLVEEQLRDRNERLAMLSQAANELLGGEDPLVLLSRLYERLSGTFGVDTFIYYDLSENGNGLELAAQGGWTESIRRAIDHIGLGQGICGQVALKRKTITVRDVQKDTRANTQIIRAAGISAYACFPLFVQDRLIGTVSFGSYTQTDWEPEVLNLLRTVCDLVATAIDRARTEAELQRYAYQLERSNRDLQEFAFVASHDLQEPLRKIEAFGAALIELSGNLPEKQIDYLGRMRNAAGRMRTMVDDLLALSRVNRQGQPFEPTDLNQIAKEVISDLEMQVMRTGGKIEVEELVVIDADPMQIRQLFQNLIGNGLKFHRQDVPPVVKVCAGKRKKNTIQITIEDNGIGFPEKEAERIFQPFQRLVGRSEYDGSGMGLSICRRIVERHQGTITAHSQPGQGSMFVLTLPLKQPKTMLER